MNTAFVAFQMGFLTEPLSAGVTLEWLLTAVTTGVNPQVRHLDKRLATEVATERPLPRVRANVPFHR